MSKHLDRAQGFHAAIRQILLKEWDPIGVAGVREAQDEYDSYVNQIYGFLIRREPKHKIVDFLWSVETEGMGLCGDRRHTDTIAEHLLRLPAQFGEIS